jgi:hypothetical protein
MKINDEYPELLNYCNYCKGQIYEDENYAVKDGNFYHLDCWEQMNTYYDGFGDLYNDSEE